MKKLNILFMLLSFLAVTKLSAHVPDGYDKAKEKKATSSQSRAGDCAQGTSRYDMEINNVRATLLSSGDVWWDLQRGLYIVPKVDPATNVPAVSAIFAGSVWLGGKDDAGNLKVACQTYRSQTETDFWPGPLDTLGQTDADQCKRWDKHFSVKGRDIDRHIKNFREARALGRDLDCASIPEGIRGWPAVGNPYFFEVHTFELPASKQGLALFSDIDNDGLYDPCKGDYPVIDVRGCKLEFYPDDMAFWIYNDNGGIHTQSQNSQPIQMEVQVQAFAYASNDELNDMTFQRYKLINKATSPINETYFAMWVDPDLGCYTDDYVGCDTTRSLMFVYNEDLLDGTTGCVCNGQVPTYCDKIPILGVDYFRGPRRPLYDLNGKPILDPITGIQLSEELGMSSFTYYNNRGVGTPLPGTTDPGTATEYYRYLTGNWRDGTPFCEGGSGYNPSCTDITKYAFPGRPSVSADWTMCQAALPFGDRRTIQASGPFRLLPGAVNELIIGVPIVFDQRYPCPDISNLQQADDIAQALFDNCFKIFDGPDAPDMNIIELDKQLVLTLTNNPDAIISNNAREQYKEKGIRIPQTQPDTMYRFQGYKIYQAPNANAVGGSDLDDPTKARLVYQVDIKDSVSTIYNWASQPDPIVPGRNVFTPSVKVEGKNLGITNTFSITEDAFASGNKTLINHKKYYFLAVAYAYNNFVPFDQKDEKGQQFPYVEGRRNRGSDGGGKPYIGIPKPINYMNTYAKYGEGVKMTRIDGTGNGGNYVDIDSSTVAKILDGSFIGEIGYVEGRAPVQVKIYNPLEVVDGEFELTLVDKDLNDNILEVDTRWILTDKTSETTTSANTIQRLNEQILAKYGFSITIGQTLDVGAKPKEIKSNGIIGSDVILKSGKTWLSAVPNQTPVKYLKTDRNEVDFDFDPNQSLTNMSLLFKPYYLCDWGRNADEQLITPAWIEPTGSPVARANPNSLSKLNNVDIVLTKDKSKWSRCVVVETANPNYYNTTGNFALGLSTQTKNAIKPKNFDLRQVPSVGKEDADGDGFPDPDGAIEPAIINNVANPKKDSLVYGMGWFPGYAIDVLTGDRLNIFFGENSTFEPDFGQYENGDSLIHRDMAWNPSAQVIKQPKLGQRNLINNYDGLFLGGQQFVYVMNTKYDSCAALRHRIDPRFRNQTTTTKVSQVRNISWTCMPFLTPGSRMLSYKDGLIPAEMTVKLRVDKAYKVESGTGRKNFYPTYNFKIAGKQPQVLDPKGIENELDLIQVVPNPYYGFSDYETNQFTNTIYMTNLPAKCNVTIYTIDGKFIREFKKDEALSDYSEKDPATGKTIYTKGARAGNFTGELAWDLKNSKGIPISSGVYLIYVNAPGKGERVIKWFGINRQLDPSGL